MYTRQRRSEAFDAARPWFHGRTLYHATPLHYLPSILWRGELIASSMGEPLGITPRKTANRRDRMLRLNSFVHLAFELAMPLLRDKLAKGMPHAVLVFDAEEVAHAHECALIPFNTKAWRARACYTPVSEPGEMSVLMRRRDEFGRFPSTELLVKERLSLSLLKEIAVFRPEDDPAVHRLLRVLLREAHPRVTCVDTFRASSPAAPHGHCLNTYFASCVRSGQVPPPPDLPFD